MTETLFSLAEDDPDILCCAPESFAEEDLLEIETLTTLFLLSYSLN